MYILDTDHISVFDRAGPSAQALLSRLARTDPNEVVTTIVTYEEQMRGWLAYVNKNSSIELQIEAYRKLEGQLANYRKITVISFDERAGRLFQDLRERHRRLGAMDLKIAAIAIVNQATVLTRNTKDFGQIAGLAIEDWTM
jgi:tRNA(fMet)-specific endonuclease VapC